MYKYSVDKIKLEFRYIKLNRVQNFLDDLSTCLDTDFKYYTSNQIVKCKHNFLFDDGKNSFYLGVIPNWHSEDKHDKNIVLEYNPNKINPFAFRPLNWLLTTNNNTTRVMNFDIAVDMDIDYNNLRMLKRDKRETFATFGSSSIETRYLGAMGDNHIKLYNKAIEQKLKNVDWSRFEITIKSINTLFSNHDSFCNAIRLPQIYYVDNQISLDVLKLNDTSRLVLESLIDDTDRLYTIKKYETRKKYEKMLSQFLKPVVIDKTLMFNAYQEYCKIFNAI